MKILAVPSAGYVGLYRTINPMEALKKKGHHVDYAYDALRWKLIEKYDVVTWNRQKSIDLELVSHYARDLGVKVVFDVDDNEALVPSWNPCFAAFYKDGARGEAVYQGIRNMRAASLVTCSTDVLAEDMSWFNEKVVVLRNQIDPSQWKGVYRLQHAEPWIGFFGSNTHKESMRRIVKPLVDVLVSTDAKLISAGYVEIVDLFPKNVWGKIYTRQFVFDNVFKSWMKACSVIVRPANDDRFTLCKSENPVLEAGAVGVPILVTDTLYGEFVKEAGCGYLVCSSDDEWKEKLIELTKSKEKSRSLGKRLHEWVFTERTYDKHVDEIEKAYEK